MICGERRGIPLEKKEAHLGPIPFITRSACPALSSVRGLQLLLKG